VNDRATVLREYASEERFLARRLSSWATLEGPLVEDATVEGVGRLAVGRVLDVGCGTGDLTVRLQQRLAGAVIALDLSPRMAALARARELHAVTADSESLPLREETFDCVVANRVLYHLPDLDKGLSEIRRVLRPGGTLLAVTYSIHHLDELWDVLGGSPIGTTFSAESGAPQLAQHFEHVERHDIVGAAHFANTDAILGYLASYGEFAQFDSERLSDLPSAFSATYRHCMFRAAKARRA
jgi:SAM-dependent methyltransferase